MTRWRTGKDAERPSGTLPRSPRHVPGGPVILSRRRRAPPEEVRRPARPVLTTDLPAGRLLLVRPTEGMAGRLRVMVTAEDVARRQGRRLVLVWPRPPWFDCSVDDLFDEPPPVVDGFPADAPVANLNQRPGTAPGEGDDQVACATSGRPLVRESDPRGLWPRPRMRREKRAALVAAATRAALERLGGLPWRPSAGVASRVSSVEDAEERVGAHIRFHRNVLRPNVGGLEHMRELLSRMLGPVFVASGSRLACEELARRLWPRVRHLDHVACPRYRPDLVDPVASDPDEFRKAHWLIKKRDHCQEALADLLVLSRCWVVLSAGTSSFGRTAAVVGDRPFVVVRGRGDAR